jgi:hypothetical protein
MRIAESFVCPGPADPIDWVPISRAVSPKVADRGELPESGSVYSRIQ